MIITKNNYRKQGLLATAYQSLYDRHGVPFSFDELEQVVINPLNVPKSAAPLIIPANVEGKTKQIIKRHNCMTWLWVDIDSGNKPLSQVLSICKTYSITNAVIYSTASAMREKKGVSQGFRWRIIILPNQALTLEDWQILQMSLVTIFGGGAEAAKATQGFFLPSCSDGGYYEYSII